MPFILKPKRTCSFCLRYSRIISSKIFQMTNCFRVSDISWNKYKKRSNFCHRKAMLRWWVGDRLRYFSGKSERKNTCGESRISMFCLKLSEYSDRKVEIGKDGPAEVGQQCSEPTSFPTLRLMLNHPPCPYLTHFLKGFKGLPVHAWM